MYVQKGSFISLHNSLTTKCLSAVIDKGIFLKNVGKV